MSSISAPEIARKLANGFIYYVAISDGVMTAVLGIEDMSTHVHIYHLFVSEEYQSAGVARQLLLTAQAAFAEKGLAREFSVNSSVFARGFYEKMGFVAESDPQERNGILIVPMKLIPGTLASGKIIV